MLALALPLAQVVRADNDKGNQKKKNKHQAEAAAPNGAQQAAPKVRQPVKQVPPPEISGDSAHGRSGNPLGGADPAHHRSRTAPGDTNGAKSAREKRSAIRWPESPEHDGINPVPGQSHEVDDIGAAPSRSAQL